MTRTRIAAVVAAAVSVGLLSGCGLNLPNALSAQGQQPPAQAAPAAPGTGTKVATAAVVGLGDVLTDQNGRTLYLFTNDEKNAGTSACEDDCAEQWPPLLVEGGVQLDGVDDKLLGTAKRADGSTQVTVGGWPAYRYNQDKQPGDAKGHGVGGVWFALGKAGTAMGELPDLEVPGEQPTEQPEQPQEEPQQEEPQARPEPPTDTQVNVATIDGLGKVLTDQDGRTLYLFTKDKKDAGTSVCDGDCAELWPALLAEGDVELEGVDEKLLGTAERSDGSKQVTIGGWPVYRYAKDKAPGDATGHNVGGVWFTIEPNGCKVSEKKSPTNQGSDDGSDSSGGYTY